MITVVFGLVGLGMLFTLLRIVKGPSLADKAVGLDALNVTVVGIILLLSVYNKNDLFLDIAIIYAVLAFLETVVFARYLEGKNDC